jgi:hypothetical protein
MIYSIFDTRAPHNAAEGFTPEILEHALLELPRRNGGGDAPWCYGTLGSLLRGENPYVVDLQKVSHRFVNLHVEDGVLLGDFVLMDKCPAGACLKEIMAIDPALVAFELRGKSHYDAWHRLTGYSLASIAAVHSR